MAASTLEEIRKAVVANQVALEALDNAIDGNEMQVDIVAELPAGTQNIGKIQPFDAVIEQGITELIGINEQVDQNDYSGSVETTLAATTSGEILAIMLVQTEDNTGAIIGESGVLFAYDADPTISSGDTTMLAVDGVTVIAKIDVSAGDWVTDTNTGIVHLTVAIPFHSLASIFWAYKHTGATSINSGANDDEQLEFNWWYRRDS